MTKEVSHIKLEYKENAANIVEWYALDEETLRKAQIWQGQQQSAPTTRQLADWLDSNGAKLDRADGPALIDMYADGTRTEAWYRQGERDRADGPAVIETSADGYRYEAWYRQGQRDRADGPAVIETSADGTRYEEWFRQGERDRADGPALIDMYADETRTEAWYIQGQLVKEERVANRSAIPGLTLYPPTPAGP